MRRAPALSLLFLVAAVLLVLVLATDDADGANKHQIRSAICSVFKGQKCGPAIRVATCETGGTLDPHSRGAAGERGLTQIHPVHFGRVLRSRHSGSIYVRASRLYEPLFNLRVAYVLSDGGRNWSPWTCKP